MPRAGLTQLTLAGLAARVRSFDRLVRWLNTAITNWTHHPTTTHSQP